MTQPPDSPWIFHITHLDNLPHVVQRGLFSDEQVIAQDLPVHTVGMSRIKERRLRECPVKCYPDDTVGQYVPFYFCPRSIMLYLLHMGNHPEVTYKGGQGPILHLALDLREVVAWATGHDRRWAFTLSNAGARYTEFRNELDHLSEIDWDAVSNRDFRSADVKEGKQAEFLVRDHVPFSLVRRIGVHSEAVRDEVERSLEGIAWTRVDVMREWYF